MRGAAPLCVARLVHINRCATAAVCTAEVCSTLPQLCSLATVTQASPQCSSTAFFATAAQPQIIKLQQEPSSNSSQSQSWIKPWLSAGAVAAVAGGAVWALRSAPAAHQAQADAATAAGLSGSSIQTHAAIVSCFAGPLVTLLQGSKPTDLQLQAMAKTLADDVTALNPRDLLDSIWGLAMLGAQLDIDQLQPLCAAAVAHLQQYSVYQAIAAVQSVIMLCRGSSSNSAAAAQLAATAWQQLLQRLKAAQLEEYDEAARLYLLHAAVQQAAAAAGAATAAAAAGDVRASLQEVLQQVDVLPKKVKSKVVAAYQEYIPFQGYIESPFLIILHILKTLPSHIQAQPAAAAPPPPPSSQTAATAPPAAAAGPYSAVFQGFTPADADAAATVVSDSGALGKLRRELFYTWRSDQLLDRHQRNLNQVAHVLNRILQLPLKQPPDVDVLLPTLKTVILLEEDTITSTPQHKPPQGSRPLQQQQQLDASDPQLLLRPQFHAACHDALVTLMRNRFSAPSGGFACKSTEGIRSAKQWCLEQRGFRVVHMGISEVEKCVGTSAGQRPKNKVADYSALEALLRSRLKL